MGTEIMNGSNGPATNVEHSGGFVLASEGQIEGQRESLNASIDALQVLYTQAGLGDIITTRNYYRMLTRYLKTHSTK